MSATLANTTDYISSGFNTTHTLNFSFTPTSGNILIVAATQGSAVSSFTANWNRIAGCTSTDSCVCDIYWKVSDGTETSFQVIITVTRHCILTVYEYSGLTNVGNDASGHTENGLSISATITASTSANTLQADELVIVLFSRNSGALGTETINSFSAGYSTLTANHGQAGGSNSLEAAVAVQEVNSIATQSCVATYQNTGNHRQASIATFYVTLPTGAAGTKATVVPSLAATQASSW